MSETHNHLLIRGFEMTPVEISKIDVTDIAAFTEEFKRVKALAENQDELQKQVDAINAKAAEIISVNEFMNFPVIEIFKNGSEPQSKTWRMDDDTKFAIAYHLVGERDDKKFAFSKIYNRLCEVRISLNETKDENLKVSKNSLAAGIKMLSEKGLLEVDVPTNKDGGKQFAKTTYTKTAKFNKSKHSNKEAITKMFADVE
jgi:hypothetical protein